MIWVENELFMSIPEFIDTFLSFADIASIATKKQFAYFYVYMRAVS